MIENQFGVSQVFRVLCLAKAVTKNETSLSSIANLILGEVFQPKVYGLVSKSFATIEYTLLNFVKSWERYETLPTSHAQFEASPPL